MTTHVGRVLALICTVFPLLAGEPYLTGIVQTKNWSVAILELRSPGIPSEKLILRPGERYENVEVVGISPEKHSMTVRIDQNAQLELQLPSTSKGPKNLHFDRAQSRQVLDVYQELADRTVIHDPSIPFTAITLETNLADPDQMLAALTAALNEKGIFLTNAGEKFVFAIRPERAADLESFRPPPRAGVAVSAEDSEVFPPGLVKFIDTHILQALEVYSELAGKTLLRPNNLPGGRVTTRSQTSLIRREAAWLLEAACHIAGFRIVESDSERFVFAIHKSRTAPLPVFDANALSQRVTKQAAPARLRLNEANADEALKLYADLVGREVAGDQNFPQTRFSVQSIGPLTALETAFALEALANLNNAAFHFTADDKVTLRRNVAK